MTNEKFESLIGEAGFSLYRFEQEGESCVELETWTSGGVNMIINLMPYTPEEFVKYVSEFDIDEMIDLHRQDPKYRQDFTISESLDDFTKFQKKLNGLVEAINKVEN